MVVIKEGVIVDKAEIKEEIIEIQTIQIAVDDKLHRILEIMSKLGKRIDKLEKLKGEWHEKE